MKKTEQEISDQTILGCFRGIFVVLSSLLCKTCSYLTRCYGIRPTPNPACQDGRFVLPSELDLSRRCSSFQAQPIIFDPRDLTVALALFSASLRRQQKGHSYVGKSTWSIIEGSDQVKIHQRTEVVFVEMTINAPQYRNPLNVRPTT